MEQTELLQKIELQILAVKDNSKKFYFLLELGNVYSKEGNYSQALKYYEEAFEVAKKNNNRKLKYDALINIGSSLFNLNKLDEAIKTYEKALTLAGELQDPKLQSIVLGKLANVYSEKGETNKASEYSQAITASEKASDQSIVDEDGTLDLKQLGSFEMLLQAYEKERETDKAKVIVTSFTNALFLLASILIGIGTNMITATSSNPVGWIAIILAAMTFLIATIISIQRSKG